MSITGTDTGAQREPQLASTPPPEAVNDSRSAQITYTPGYAEREPEAWTRRQRIQRVVLGVLPPIILLSSWQLAVGMDWLDGRLFSNPVTVGDSFWELLTSGALIEDALITLRRMFSGYIAGSVLGIVIGLSIGRVRLVRSMLMPTISAIFTVPKLGLFPLLLLIFGLGETPRFILIAFGAFLVVVLSTVDAASNIDQNYLDVAKVFKASRRGRFFEVILPATLPAIFTVLRVTVSLSMLLVVATEFVASREGLGFLIWNSWNLFRPETMYVGLVTTALLGVAGYSLLGVLERLFMPWAARTRGRPGSAL